MNQAFRTAVLAFGVIFWRSLMSGRLVGLSSMATRHILADLARDYEARKGTRVEIRSMGGVEAAKLVRAGEATDVVVLASKVMASLEAEGHLAKGSRERLRAVGDRHCRPRGLATAEHCKRTRGQTGHAGCAKDLLFDRSQRRSLEGACARNGASPTPCWRARLSRRRACRWPRWSANGEADLGFQQLSELIGQPGVEVVGPLPPEIQAVTVFSAGVASKSADPEAAHAFVAFLASAETAGAKRRYGMEPA